MALITKPNTFSGSTTILSSEVNTNFDTIFNDYNGNIADANIAAGAAITETKINFVGSLVVRLTTNQTIAGIKTFSSFPVTPSSAPTTDYQVSNKKYVDDNTLANEAAPAQGEVAYYDGSGWVGLGVGTDGQVLQTQGAAANPQWVNANEVLNQYDSGWFAVSASSSYEKTHNLGTKLAIWQVYVSDSATGASNVYPITACLYTYDNMNTHGTYLADMTTTTVDVHTGQQIAAVPGIHTGAGSDGWTSGYARIIGIALE